MRPSRSRSAEAQLPRDTPRGSPGHQVRASAGSGREGGVPPSAAAVRSSEAFKAFLRRGAGLVVVADVAGPVSVSLYPAGQRVSSPSALLPPGPSLSRALCGEFICNVKGSVRLGAVVGKIFFFWISLNSML